MTKQKLPSLIGYFIALWRIFLHIILFKGYSDLNLSNLNLRRLPLLISFIKMSTLNASNNRLKRLPPFFGRSRRKILSLQLAHNRFKAIPEQIFNISFATTLNLSENQISEIPKDIMKMSNLNYLLFFYNQLEEIPDCICDMTELHTLGFSGNPKIKKLPMRIGSLSQLQQLHLDNTCIRQLPKSMANTIIAKIEQEYPIIMPHNFTKIEIPNHALLNSLSLPLEAMSIPKELENLPPKDLIKLGIANREERKRLVESYLNKNH